MGPWPPIFVFFWVFNFSALFGSLVIYRLKNYLSVDFFHSWFVCLNPIGLFDWFYLLLFIRLIILMVKPKLTWINIFVCHTICSTTGKVFNESWLLFCQTSKCFSFFFFIKWFWLSKKKLFSSRLLFIIYANDVIINLSLWMK